MTRQPSESRASRDIVMIAGLTDIIMCVFSVSNFNDIKEILSLEVLPFQSKDHICHGLRLNYRTENKIHMGLWITLRQNLDESFFRQHLLNLISDQIRGNYLILASGYFNSRNYEILDDRLLQAIIDNRNLSKIMVVGAIAPSSTAFTEFCERLSDEWSEVGREVTSIRFRGNKWHAKIAMKLQLRDGDKTPVCAIIGSSNLTRPAYGVPGEPPDAPEYKHFNHECDVVIFVKDWYGITTEKIPPLFPGFKKQDLGSIYFTDLPDGCPNELDQMKRLLKEIEENIH
jgi:hypothetical protein